MQLRYIQFGRIRQIGQENQAKYPDCEICLQSLNFGKAQSLKDFSSACAVGGEIDKSGGGCPKGLRTANIWTFSRKLE